jgi:hypothetical protein
MLFYEERQIRNYITIARNVSTIYKIIFRDILEILHINSQPLFAAPFRTNIQCICIKKETRTKQKR